MNNIKTEVKDGSEVMTHIYDDVKRFALDECINSGKPIPCWKRGEDMNCANDGHIVTVAYEVTDLVDTEVSELTGRLWFLYAFDPEKVTPVGDDGSYTFRLHAIGWMAENMLTHEEGEGITSDLDSVRTLDWSLGEVLYHELNYVQPKNIEFPKPDPRFTYEENWEAIVEFLTSNTEYYVPALDCICLSSSWG